MSKPIELVIKGDRKEEPLAKTIVTSVKLHQQLMGLDDWYGVLVFKKVDSENGGDCMESESWPQYKKFEISADLDSLADSTKYIHHYVRHELFHVLVWFMFEICAELSYKKAEGAMRKLEERVIYDLEHMPLWEHVYENLTT